MKKLLFLAITAMAIPAFIACSSDDDKTTFVEFEDINFKAYCLEHFDTDNDGTISQEEADAVTNIGNWLDIDGVYREGYELPQNIKSLAGIKLFRNIEYIHCAASDEVEYIDVSGMKKLIGLICPSSVKSLNVKGCTALEALDCIYGNLTTLNVSENTKLKRLDCFDNQLTSLDLSKNTKLEQLWCNGNQLTTLDVSKNTELNWLACRDHQLTTLDVSKNTKLTYLACSDNNLTTLDVSKNTELYYLYCSNNQLTTLDVSKNTALTYLSCENNPNLTELWLANGQTIPNLNKDSHTVIKYK